MHFLLTNQHNMVTIYNHEDQESQTARISNGSYRARRRLHLRMHFDYASPLCEDHLLMVLSEQITDQIIPFMLPSLAPQRRTYLHTYHQAFHSLTTHENAQHYRNAYSEALLP